VLDVANWEARTEAYYGRVSEGHEGTRGAIQQAVQLNFKEWAARYSTEEAEVQSILGRCTEARRAARAALEWSRDTATLDIGARALGWCGDPLALELTKEMAQRFPNASLRLHVSIPIVTAAYLARTGKPAEALTEIERVKPYEDATMAKLWPAYLRGQIYMARKEPLRAAPEFQRVIDHRSESADSLLYPMALLGRARAAVASGARGAAEGYYAELFDLWRGADKDLEPLVQAQREALQLH